MQLLAVVIGGAIGSVLRWCLGMLLNPILPTLPLGTLTANLSGGLLIGMVISLVNIFPVFPDVLRLGLITGFLGGLTTFSTFSAEIVHLLGTKSYLNALIGILCHVGGSLLMTLLGIFSIKLIFRGG